LRVPFRVRLSLLENQYLKLSSPFVYLEAKMSEAQRFPFVHYSRGDNKTITESHCLLCGVLVAGGTANKFLAIAEAAHKCPMVATQ
jgi:hypothetical protein